MNAYQSTWKVFFLSVLPIILFTPLIYFSTYIKQLPGSPAESSQILNKQGRNEWGCWGTDIFTWRKQYPLFFYWKIMFFCGSSISNTLPYLEPWKLWMTFASYIGFPFYSLLCSCFTKTLNIQRMNQSPALVAHGCNPCYSGSKDQEDHSSKPAPGN
jgi:hypothetical protein